MADEPAWLGQGFWTADTVVGGIANHGGVTTGYGVNVGFGASGGLRDDAAEAFRAFVPGIETYIFLDVGTEFDFVILKVANARHRINRKDIHRDVFKCGVLEHGVGQHVATNATATPAHQVYLSGNNTVLAEGFHLMSCLAVSRSWQPSWVSK
jgi:hypothetical protein